jgi:hypothetical protein
MMPLLYTEHQHSVHSLLAVADARSSVTSETVTTVVMLLSKLQRLTEWL